MLSVDIFPIKFLNELHPSIFPLSKIVLFGRTCVVVVVVANMYVFYTGQ